MEKEEAEFKADKPINERRYHLITFKHFNGEIKTCFFKFTEKPYLSAEGGFSESINTEHLKEVMALYHLGYLSECFVCYKDGAIYKINPPQIILNSSKETDSEGTEKYIFNIKLMERYNNE
jgi:hypothetical protein